MLVRRVTRLPGVREMDGANRFEPIPLDKIAWRPCLQSAIRVSEFVQQTVNHAAQHALRKTFCRRVDRRDPAKMDRDLLVSLDDLEFRMVHANSLSAQPRLAENDQT